MIIDKGRTTVESNGNGGDHTENTESTENDKRMEIRILCRYPKLYALCSKLFVSLYVTVLSALSFIPFNR